MSISCVKKNDIDTQVQADGRFRGSIDKSRNLFNVFLQSVIINQNGVSFVFLQIFYDLVRQINKKSPEKKQKQKKKSSCCLL